MRMPPSLTPKTPAMTRNIVGNNGVAKLCCTATTSTHFDMPHLHVSKGNMSKERGCVLRLLKQVPCI